jgi:hypothetical protein
MRFYAAKERGIGFRLITHFAPAAGHRPRGKGAVNKGREGPVKRIGSPPLVLLVLRRNLLKPVSMGVNGLTSQVASL